MTKKSNRRSLLALFLSLAILLSLVPSTAFAQKIEVGQADLFGFEKPALASTKNSNDFANLLKPASIDPYRVEFVALKNETGAPVTFPHTFSQEGNYTLEYKVIIDGTKFATHTFSANPNWTVRTTTGKQITSSAPATAQTTANSSSFTMSIPFRVESETLLSAPPNNLRIDVASDSVKAKFDAPQSDKSYSARLYLLKNGEPHPLDTPLIIEKSIVANAPLSTEDWDITNNVKKSGKYTVVLVYKPEGSSDYLYGSKMESAMYEPQAYPLTITNGAVLGGSADNKYVPGETIRIAAADPQAGQVFDKWEVLSGGVTLADATQTTTTFTMPTEPVTLKATYKSTAPTKYLVTVEDGTLANNPPVDGKYAQGETVSIVANPTPTGQVFDKWVVTSGTGVVFADETAAQTNFTMPAGEVKVKATYKNAPATTKYLVTVENGALSGTVPADNKYAQGETVSITANAAPTGQVFDKWEVVSGTVTLANATQTATTFTMPASEVKVKATYKPATAITKYLVTVENGALSGTVPADNKYAQGETVSITANAAPTGQVFDKWEVVSGTVTLANATQTATTFTMPASEVKVKATYKPATAITKYLVTVENGALSGTVPADNKYAQGETVSITANAAPTGQVFDKWEVVSGTVTLADATQTNTTFTMPAGEVKVKATYKPATATTKYLVTVENGALSGTVPADNKYAQGETVSITANAAPTGQVFDKWEVVSGGVTLADATQTATTFTMPASEVKVKATYKNAPATTKYLVTVENGALSGTVPADNKYAQGETVSITANAAPTGQVFDKWEVVSGGVTLANATQASTTFTMPAGEVKVKATYKPATATTKYLVTVENGALSGTVPADNKYAQGETVSITANAAPTGQVFDKWEVVSGTVTLTDATQNATTFTMPASEVKVKATYKPAPATTYAVTVIDGGGAGNYAQNVTVTITANAAPSGQVFDKWEVVSGGVTLANATQSTTTFVMPANAVNVKATYKPAPATPTTYAVTVVDGSGGGNYAQNATVTITANTAPSGKIFDKWEVLEGNVTLANPAQGTTTFSMPANAVKVKAVYRDLIIPSMTSSSTYYHPELNNSPSKKPDVLEVKPSSVKPKAPEVTEGGKANAQNLTDISNHWANSAITYCVERNIMRGMSEKTFAPNTSVTRGMFVTILGNLSAVDKAGYTAGKFSDSLGKYYSPYVNWANENGIALGVSSDKFMPNTAITREQLAVMIVKYAKHANIDLGSNSPQKVFTDANSISPWAKDAVSTLQMSGIMEGQNGNRFNPKAKATRAEVCLIMQKLTMLIDK